MFSGTLRIDPFTTTLLILLTITLYLVITTVYLSARRKYQGGIVGNVINMIITTIGFFLLADIALFLIPVYGMNVGYTIHVVFKIVAMSFLAVGGLKFLAR